MVARRHDVGDAGAINRLEGDGIFIFIACRTSSVLKEIVVLLLPESILDVKR